MREGAICSSAVANFNILTRTDTNRVRHCQDAGAKAVIIIDMPEECSGRKRAPEDGWEQEQSACFVCTPICCSRGNKCPCLLLSYHTKTSITATPRRVQRGESGLSSTARPLRFTPRDGGLCGLRLLHALGRNHNSGGHGTSSPRRFLPFSDASREHGHSRARRAVDGL